MTVHNTHWHDFPDFDDLIIKLEQMRSQIGIEYDHLLQDYSERDARVTTIARLGILIDSTNLAFTFITKHLLPLDNIWWQEIHKPPFENFDDYRHKSVTVNNFSEGFLKVGFVQNLFSIFDSSFRILLRELDSDVSKYATYDFYQIHKDLGKKVTFPVNSDKLIKLLRLVRNTVHNNGVYFNKNGKDDEVEYQGVKYNFHHGQSVKFVHWEWLINRFEEAQQLLIQIVNDPKVTSRPNEIPDPFNN
jgi:hypothetical protein